MNQNSYRLNITIPQRLKAQMDQLGEQVNWSSVAAEAFQRKIAEVQSGRKRSTKKESIVSRLKAAEKNDPKGFEAGYKAGAKWAEEKALPRHLRKVEKGVDAVFEKEIKEGSPWTLATNLAHAITGESQISRCTAFLRDAVGEDGQKLMEEEEFARGFIDGAREVWEEVKYEL